MSSFNSNFDNLLVQTLMGRLQIRPSPSTNPLLSQSLEDLLFDSSNLSDDSSDTDESRTQLSKEESKLEKAIIKLILSQDTQQTLKPNSGQAVTINDHHICVGYHEEPGSDYRVWEWHGHIMLFDEENGYTPEYIYGNYFERVPVVAKAQPQASGQDEDDKDVNEGEKEEKAPAGNLGLRELIGDADSGSARVLHRSLNATSPRV